VDPVDRKPSTPKKVSRRVLQGEGRVTRSKSKGAGVSSGSSRGKLKKKRKRGGTAIQAKKHQKQSGGRIPQSSSIVTGLKKKKDGKTDRHEEPAIGRGGTGTAHTKGC